MWRYFQLSLSQLVLIISLSLPVAFVFSVQISTSGLTDAGTFRLTACGCVAGLWVALAMYMRDTDRRRCLPDVLMTTVRCGNADVDMRQNEKAEIIWQVLNSDALYREQTRMWWRGMRMLLLRAIVRAPATLLLLVAGGLWLCPGDLSALLMQLKAAAPASQAAFAGGVLLFVYVITGEICALSEIIRCRGKGMVCFVTAYQEGVCRYVRQQREGAERPGTEVAE
ncbi:hypothetical protein GW952_31545 (plasmid) [Klebsiella michiganensis]|uniref:Uncharacterized protein n=2 Tax=Klebsiella michiganensis TaxID=1134687 RepID=A0A6P1V7R4_9ENTR|nr:hypothetical protein [Klebsiella michiganensis]QHS50152.1 hypothetical protein GW952_31545 [Klebsiella michiganensis]